MKKIILFSAAVLALAGLAACDKGGGIDTDDAKNEKFRKIAERFVNNTVIPTYRSLSDETAKLAESLETFQDSKSQANLDAACTAFLDARAYWEKSEAFLFGAAGDFGIDPHIDSWPLDLDALKRLLDDGTIIESLKGEGGDAYAGEQLGNALLGFHGIEYILFRDGHNRNASDITEIELIYAIAVSGDLRNRCWQMDLAWAGEGNVAEERFAKVAEDLELPYTVNSSDNSYGDNMLNAGNAGSTYASLTVAMQAIISGCKTIADEVGTSKIGKPHSGEDPAYIESPYSYKSILDFHDNIISIKNVYMGGIEGDYNETVSLHGYISEADPDLDSRIMKAIENAIDKIDAMKAPFVLNYTDPSATDAIEACKELDSILSEASRCVAE